MTMFTKVFDDLCPSGVRRLRKIHAKEIVIHILNAKRPPIGNEPIFFVG